jgi:hypothetical protein
MLDLSTETRRLDDRGAPRAALPRASFELEGGRVMRRVLALLLLAGCSRGAKVDLGSSDAGVGHASVRLHEVKRLAAADPLWSAVLSSPRLRQVNGAFSDRGFDDAIAGVPMAFGARLSSFGDGAVEVRAGDAQVSWKVAGARSVQGALAEGDVVYEDVHPSTDLVASVGPGRVETFWSLRDSTAPTTYMLALELAHLSARIEDGAVVFVDDSGTTRLRMPKPSAIDAKGVRRDATLRLDGSTLTIALDSKGLSYPILLDPALEQVLWTDLGPDLPSGPSGTSYPRVSFPDNLQRASGSARSGNGLVYLFGGARVYQSDVDKSVQVPNTQLFEWNGSAWSATAGGDFGDPLVASGSETSVTLDRTSDIAWDSARKKLVLFGGFAMAGSTPHLGVYEYDPIATKVWTKMCADDSPCASSSPTVASPIPSPPAAVYAFGKSIVVQENGTWEWNPTTKLLVKFAATPDFKRAGAAIAFDPNRNRIVAYGSNAGASDTWESNGTTWTQVLATGPPAVRNTSLAYHGNRKEMILWGSDGSSGGLWSWSGAAWTAMTLSGGAPTPRPNAAFTYDDTRGKLLMVGGGSLGGSCYNSWLVPPDNNSDLRGCNRVDTWTSIVFGGACTTNADCGAALSCVDGVCCQSTSCATCERCDLAGSVGKCSKVTSAEDTDTCTGTKACDATGACRKKAGQVCAIGTDCLSGNCADGICCNNACPGVCESCNQASSLGTCTPLAKGAPGKGCGYFTCTGTTSSCATSCAADADCAPNAYCNSSGACVVLLTKGLACTRGRQCATGACVDGVCCDSGCSGTCDVCSKALGATVDGTCTILPKTASPVECGAGRCSGTSAACATTCTVDGDCSATGFCTGGSCVTLRNKGESSDRTAQCASGLTCADGVCCNEACDGACRACSALNKQSGDKSGECGPAKEGTNPRSKCVKSAVTSCGQSGLCDATGSCSVYAAGTPCGPTGSTSCDGDLVKGQTCDGLGTCALDTGGTSCSPFLCTDGACTKICATDAECAADAFCLGGKCTKKSAAGKACAVDAQCTSGFCADGVCCSARCDGPCEACDQMGAEGTCAPVTGAPHLGHPACAAGDPTNPCSPAACDGVDRTTCAKKVGPEVTCRTGSCEDGVESLPTKCDGSGTCPAAETRPCQPFACGADACKKTCEGDKDCGSGFVCNVATGACTGGDKCAGSVVTKVDGSTIDCAPYTCESSGRCKTVCATSADCVSPKVCDGSACIDPPDASTDSSGGCALSPDGVRSGAGAIFLAAALASTLRRRRRH